MANLRVGRYLPIFLMVLYGGCGASNAPPLSETAKEEVPELAEVILTELREGLRVHTLVAPEISSGVTSHVIETKSHLVIIDTQLLIAHSAQLRELCDSLSKPIDRVIVSHGHPDHYFGISHFDKETPIFALASTQRQMKRRLRGHVANHQRMEGALAPTEVTFPTHTLESGPFVVDDVTFEVQELAAAEDVTQVLLSIPSAKAVFAQDVVSNGYHAFTGTGPVDGWRDELQKMISASPEFVFAGHGRPGGAPLIQFMVDYLTASEEAKARAETQESFVEDMRSRYPKLRGEFLIEITAVIVFRDRAKATH